LKRAVLLAGLLTLLVAGGARGGALVEVGDLVLRADGGFQPRHLPRHRFAPIGFGGQISLESRSDGAPPALRRAVVEFDRDGRLGVAGLPTCAARRVAALGPGAARRRCRGAIVGRGRVEATIALPGGPVQARSALTIFNGPRQGRRPTVVLHARTTVPAVQTYAIVVPIAKRRGEFRYRATLEVPPIAGGLGAITLIKARIERRYRADGKRRSYISARCSDGILRTRGRFSFADGTVVDGAIEKFCRAR